MPCMSTRTGRWQRACHRCRMRASCSRCIACEWLCACLLRAWGMPMGCEGRITCHQARGMHTHLLQAWGAASRHLCSSRHSAAASCHNTSARMTCYLPGGMPSSVRSWPNSLPSSPATLGRTSWRTAPRPTSSAC